MFSYSFDMRKKIWSELVKQKFGNVNFGPDVCRSRETRSLNSTYWLSIVKLRDVRDTRGAHTPNSRCGARLRKHKNTKSCRAFNIRRSVSRTKKLSKTIAHWVIESHRNKYFSQQMKGIYQSMARIARITTSTRPSKSSAHHACMYLRS
jgi:hypothetical protein